MYLEKQQGFTIIEVTLFLGISGLLFLMIFIGTGNTLRTTRFTDSIRSTQSYLQQQADQILNGVNSRDASNACNAAGITSGGMGNDPGTSNCLLLGRTLYFHDSQIDAYPVVATVIPSLYTSAGQVPTDQELILASKPQIVYNAKDTYTIPWQNHVEGGLLSQAAGVTANTVTILRSPASTQLFYYSTSLSSETFQNGAISSLKDLGVLTVNGPSPTSYLNSPTTYCFTEPSGQTMVAAITVASNKGNEGQVSALQATQAQNAVTVQFDVSDKEVTCGA
jgi:Tfp pilus assembly protein PilV